ncbi:MAG: glycosyltransferase family 2 protein [Phenylobacterium sp.]|uniref:glycosyltransferase family 2 protein n=1 Tax=Phenylobacterium sp. TaxID=1871053 RepID=UPI001A51AC98|nr:glycosyltransferase family 2 protein [Phenylobacterium sp.]MBL8771754.1 glycosyltransferase family 2 protein [Phenylobacterium sp.]
MRLEGRSVPDRPGEIRACLVVRNEMLRLQSVLDHHRALGVDRFLVIDDGSTDGTRAFVAAQPDAHLLTGEGRFAARRLGWVNAVLDAYCDGHWTLTVDADEQFVFPAFDRVGLRQLCRFLDGQGAEGLLALMLDMFGGGDVREAVHTPGDPLVETCPWFDPGPYHAVRAGPFPHVQFHGGPRARLFDFTAYQPRPPVLSKVPLVKWRRGRRYLMATHAITPLSLPPMLAALLHFKFLSDFPERVAVAIDEGQHYGGSREYRAYRDGLGADGGLVLRDERSLRYRGPDQLLAHDIIQASEAYLDFVAGVQAA